MSEALCIEVWPYGIFVSIVAPGLLQTRFALEVGTKEASNNPYQPVLDEIRASIQERLAHPERLHLSQTAEEIAEFLWEVIRDPQPKLRYQTSEAVREMVSSKLLDLTGDAYLNLLKE